MYLKQTKQKNGRIYVSITRGFRDEFGKSRNITEKSFGYLDDLEREWGPDALERCQRICDEMTKAYNESQKPYTIDLYTRQKVDKRSVNRKIVGDAVILAFYNALSIEMVLRNHVARRKMEYDTNAICRLLVSERMLYPGSKRAAWQNSDRHFPKCKSNRNDIYRALDDLGDCKEKIIAAINRAIKKNTERDLECCYYDVTNYYFECDEDGFRRRGAEKNHRRSPIVQMGLLQDGCGIPITYNLFPGNTHDSTTLIDSLSDLKQACKTKRIVIVADKGLNSSNNIACAIGKGDGFVFSQSIRGTKSDQELRKWVISENGYKQKGEDGFKIKSRQDTKTITITDAQGHKVKVDIEIKVVAFWSRKYEMRARHEREKVLKKTYELIDNPGKYNSHTHRGAAKYATEITFDRKTGEVIDCGKNPTIDYEAIQRDEQCDGYYCIITSETDWSDERIIEAYRELWRIEESFRLTKSELEARPVFVQTRKHIEAHFLICYIALVITRLMQNALGHAYSAHAILDDLKQVACSNIDSNIWLFDHRTDLTDRLFSLIGEQAPHKFMARKEIKSLFKKDKKVMWR